MGHSQGSCNNNYRHGGCGTPTYAVYKAMRQRCLNPKNIQYPQYGGRGITICRRWLESFAYFLVDMGDAPLGFSLDRKNNSKGYSPSNCRWTDRHTQNNNKRTNFILEYKGKKQTLAQWCRELKLDYTRVKQRFHAGWSVTEAFENIKNMRKITCLKQKQKKN